MIDAAVLTEPDAGAVVALTDAYNRLWSLARDLVNETDDLPSDEFARCFTLLSPVAVPDRLDQFAMMSAKFESQSKQASMLLRQLGGWFDGVITALTFSQRIEDDAAGGGCGSDCSH
jgi:hypothetical protein